VNIANHVAAHDEILSYSFACCNAQRRVAKIELALYDRLMKVREIYSSYLLVSGVICLALGIGNWTVGVIETSKYQALLYKTARTGLEENYRNFQQLDHQKNEEVLRRINEDREKYNGARVKLNFFYVVLVGGRVLLLIGAVLTLATLVRLIRRDTQMKIKRLLRLAEADDG
jgi:hypothetical protein